MFYPFVFSHSSLSSFQPCHYPVFSGWIKVFPLTASLFSINNSWPTCVADRLQTSPLNCHNYHYCSQRISFTIMQFAILSDWGLILERGSKVDLFTNALLCGKLWWLESPFGWILEPSAPVSSPAMPLEMWPLLKMLHDVWRAVPHGAAVKLSANIFLCEAAVLTFCLFRM